MALRSYLKDEIKDLIGLNEVSCSTCTFTEGSKLALCVNGKNILRKVRWNRQYGLYIMLNGYAVSYDDFE